MSEGDGVFSEEFLREYNLYDWQARRPSGVFARLSADDLAARADLWRRRPTGPTGPAARRAAGPWAARRPGRARSTS